MLLQRRVRRSVYYARGDDYFAQQRLMTRHHSSVAEYDGYIVGVSSDAIFRLRICGTDYHATIVSTFASTRRRADWGFFLP